MFKGIFKKADFILLAVLVVWGLATSYALSTANTAGDKVVIDVAGERYGTYPLHEDREVKIKRDNCSNTVLIKDGAVSMASASCKNQVCVHHASINKTGQSIICLPNRVVVKIEGKGDKKYDAISN